VTGDDVQLTCVITRLEIAHAWQLPSLWLHRRRVRRAVSGCRGLVAFSFLQESLRTYYSISFWVSPLALVGASQRSHVEAVRFSRSLRAVWSTQWHLTRLSPYSQGWPGKETIWLDMARASGALHSIPSAVTRCSGQAVRADPNGQSPYLVDSPAEGSTPEPV